MSNDPKLVAVDEAFAIAQMEEEQKSLLALNRFVNSVDQTVRRIVPRPRTFWGSKLIAHPTMSALAYIRYLVTSDHNPGGFLGEAMSKANG